MGHIRSSTLLFIIILCTLASSEVSSTTSSPHHKDHSSSTSKLKLPEKRLKSKRPYSYLAAMDEEEVDQTS